MDKITASEKHWAVDSANSQNKTDDLADKIKINSIEANIERYKIMFSNHNTFALDNQVDYNQDEVKFETPQFEKSYLISDTKSYFTKAQKWIGHVLEKKEKTFKAKLTDITNPGTFEIGEFQSNEVSDEDKELLSIGATFYWSLGHANINGQRKQESFIRFQRYSPWTSSDFDQAADRARRLSEKLNWK